MAAAPSFTAGRSLNPPPKRPMGVRAPSMITDEVMAALLSTTGEAIVRTRPGLPSGGRAGRGHVVNWPVSFSQRPEARPPNTRMSPDAVGASPQMDRLGGEYPGRSRVQFVPSHVQVS